MHENVLSWWEELLPEFTKDGFWNDLCFGLKLEGFLLLTLSDNNDLISMH